MARIITAGLLVGAGTGMGNGCTSGHGICGVSRFSVRSMAYTGLFMASGFACATAFATNAALGVDSSYAALSHVAIPAAETLTRYGAILASSAAAFLGLGVVGRNLGKKSDGDHTPAHERLNLVVEALSGLVFGVGLTISGMRRAAKVSGFLSATAASFDPSLMLVMGGAMAVAIPGFFVAGRRSKPTCGREFTVPKNKTIDAKLAVGGLMFGAGWGLAGLCPGPAIVSAAARPTGKLLAWLGAVAVGMFAQSRAVR
jgi:uncharacterized membrane protein YedE/YeeE|tara:strand:- start:86 stop:856 length:771 start_codon:yes stop_codon:yes gene_type:complete